VQDVARALQKAEEEEADASTLHRARGEMVHDHSALGSLRAKRDGQK